MGYRYPKRLYKCENLLMPIARFKSVTIITTNLLLLAILPCKKITMPSI